MKKSDRLDIREVMKMTEKKFWSNKSKSGELWHQNKRNITAAPDDVCCCQTDAFSVSVWKCSLTDSSHTAGSKLFYTAGPLKAQLCLPVDVCTLGSWMPPVDADHHCGWPGSADTFHWDAELLRYTGATLLTHFHTRTVTLKITCCWTDRQWRLCRTDTTWSQCWFPNTK